GGARRAASVGALAGLCPAASARERPLPALDARGPRIRNDRSRNMTASSSSARKGDEVRRVGIIFSGGPAPGANAVIAAAATSFMEDNREVVGFFHGYSNLQEYHPASHRMVPGEH